MDIDPDEPCEQDDPDVAPPRSKSGDVLDVNGMSTGSQQGTEAAVGGIPIGRHQLYLTLEDIDHSKTKARSPQSNGICERFHKTVLNEFYRIAFRKKIYNTLDELQTDLDTWIKYYNEERTHSGKYCFGKTPMQTFLDSMLLVREKTLNNTLQIEEPVCQIK